MDLASGSVSRVAGDGTSGCQDSADPAQVAVAASPELVNDGQFLYWIDAACGSNGNPRLRRMSLASGAVSRIPGIVGATALTIGGDGSLIAAIRTEIDKVDPDTGQTTSIATLSDVPSGTRTLSQTVFSLAADGSYIWAAAEVADNYYSAGNSLTKITFATGSTTTVYDPTAAHTGMNPVGRLIGTDDSLYSAVNNRVVRIAKSSGAFSVIAGTSITGYRNATGAQAAFGDLGAIDTDGTALIVADPGNSHVRRVTPGTVVDPVQPAGWTSTVSMSVGAVTTLASSTSPALSIAGAYAYVTEAGSVRKVNLASGAVTTVAGDGSSDCHDSDTAAEAKLAASSTIVNDGSFLYWADAACGPPYSSALRRMSLTTGAVSTVPKLQGARGLTLASGGSLIAGFDDGTIAKFDPGTGELTTVATMPFVTSGTRTLRQSVVSLTSDGSSIWVAANVTDNSVTLGNSLSKVDPGTGVITTIYNPATRTGLNPVGRLVSAGKFLYSVRDSFVLRVAKTDGSYLPIAGTGTAGYADGQGVQAAFGTIGGIDTNGTSLFVADPANGRVRQINIGLPASQLPTQAQGGYPSAGPGSTESPGAGNASEQCGCGQGQTTGNPVNTSTGYFWHTFDDLARPGRGVALHVTRSYVSSNAGSDSLFGRGWSSNLDIHLTEDASTGAVSVHQEDGSEVAFVPDGAGHYNSAQPRILATLKEDSSGTYTFTRSHRLTYRFNAAGLLTSVVDLNGAGTTFGYDPDGTLKTATDDGGRQFTFTVTGGHIMQVSDGNGHAYAYTYNAGNELTSVTDPTNDTWTFTYDTNHRLLTMLNPRQQGATTPQPLTNVYDSSGRVTKQTDYAGRTTLFDYTSIAGATKITDPVGRVTVDYYTDGLRTKTTKAYGTSLAATTNFTYDPTTLGIASVNDPLSHQSSTTYDADGNVLTTTDALNRTSTYTYDNLNDLLTSTDPMGVTTTRTYDTHGNLLTVSTPLKDTAGMTVATQKTTYSYEDNAHPGDVTTSTTPNGDATHYTYDSKGNLLSVTAPATAENALGNKTSYVYDSGTGWRTAMTTARGNVAGATASDFTTTYAYDDDGRPLRVRDPLWSATSPTKHQTSMTYDDDGNLSTAIDGNGYTTSYAYDADGELLTTTLPDAKTRQQSWTAGGQLNTSTDPASHVTTNAYDALGRLATVKDPLNHTTTYTYDLAGRLTLRAASGSTCTGTSPTTGCAKYTYDAGDQLLSRTYLDGLTDPINNITYDDDGRRKTETDRSGTTTTTYDSLGRVTSSKDGHNTTTSYGYDLNNNQTSISYPGTGHTITHAYDAVNRQTSSTDWLSNTVQYSYDANSNPTTATFPTATGETDTTTYNSLDAVSSISDTRTSGGSTTTLAGFSYTRDGLSQLSSSTTTGSITEAAQNYSHDSRGRLTTSGATSPATTYGYSPSDDLTNRGSTSGGTVNTQAFNAGDQVCWSSATTVTSPACGTVPSGATTYTYDVNGNRITSKAGTATAASYGYDQAQQLNKYTSPSGTVTTYNYDANGLRQNKTTSGTTTRFYWDPTTRQLLYDGTNYYLYDNSGLPLGQISASGTVTWLHHDQLGSTRLLTSTSGAVVGTATYDPYGNKKSSSGTVTTPLGYDGQYTDTDSNLIYLRARYYDTTTGQFLTPDPMRAATGQPYSYASGDPSDNDDPGGLLPGWVSSIAKHTYSGLEGFANTVTGGGVAWLDEKLSPGSTCTYDHDAYYIGGELTGVVILAIATDGGSLEVEAAEEGEAGVAGVEAADTEATAGSSAARSCLNSFTADTPVTMADGTTKPIEDVKVGDQVLATDPKTGETRAEPVEQLIRHSGKHKMVLVELADGSVLDSTDGHPIWDVTADQFTAAGKLHVGDEIETASGALLTITSLTGYSTDLTAYNLQISTIHTYYAGSTPVLVHNSCRRPTTSTRRQADENATHESGEVRCQYCEEPTVPNAGSPSSREYDHVIPHSQGGGRGSDNIVVACRTCNRQKGARTPGEWGGR